ncbi:MAG: sugar ABC transporter permease [Chloroflexi bacterium]|nr:sugar ABC transporter permease [Chloroflexota bacterium]
MSRQRIKENLTGYLFILPSVLIIGLFGLFPIIFSVYMSTLNWRARKGGFIGLSNYQQALGDFSGVLLFVAGILLFVAAYFIWNRALRSSDNRVLIGGVLAALALIGGGYVLSSGWGQMIAAGDKRFLNALPITLFYSLGTVPAELFLGLVLAYILFQKIRGKELFRMIYFLPYITPAIATAVVFRNIFSPRESSLANWALSAFGIEPMKWLFEPRPIINVIFGTNFEGFLAGPSMALVSIILYGIWTYVGYNVIVFLAGLGSIPNETYEAAEIDGASHWQMFRHVTVPLISPVTFYLALVAFIGTFKAFNHIYVMRTPNALGTVDVASVAIFDTFYKMNNYGYAAAQAIILFVIIAALTYAQNRIFSEKVFYG